MDWWWENQSVLSDWKSRRIHLFCFFKYVIILISRMYGVYVFILSWKQQTVSSERQLSYSLCLWGSERGGEGGGGRVTVVGASTGSSMGKTSRVPRIATSCSATESSWSRPSSKEPTPPPARAVEECLGLTVRDPDASVLTVTSAYMELTLASFRMKSESSSWSWPSFWRVGREEAAVNASTRNLIKIKNYPRSVWVSLHVQYCAKVVSHALFLYVLLGKWEKGVAIY